VHEKTPLRLRRPRRARGIIAGLEEEVKDLFSGPDLSPQGYTEITFLCEGQGQDTNLFSPQRYRVVSQVFF